MKPRLRAIFLVLLLTVFGVALKHLDAVTTAVAPAVLAQPYPGVSPTPTDSGYPGPPATGAATATATPTPTATVPTPTAATPTPTAATSTPTASNTVPITLSPTPRRRIATATPTRRNQPARATGTANVSQQQARETRVPARDAGPVVATPAAEAIVAPTQSGTPESRLARNAERPVLPSLAPPAADLLPPVANQPADPGAPLTLAVGAGVAGVAYWAWRRWEASDTEE